MDDSDSSDSFESWKFALETVDRACRGACEKNSLLVRRVDTLSSRISRTRACFAAMKQNKSLRIAKLLQIMKHPEIAGCRGRFSVLWKAFFSRKPLAEEYSVYSVPDSILSGAEDPGTHP